MIGAEIPEGEAERLAALRSYDILDSEINELQYEDIVKLAAAVCGTPMAVINFVDSDRQWGKAMVGLGSTEASREASFCAHTILGWLCRAKTIGLAGPTATAKRVGVEQIRPQQPGWSIHRLRRIAVVMRIVVPDAGSASALADRLNATYGRKRIVFSGDRAEVAVEVANTSDGAVIAIVESVERWLDHTGLASAEMWLGEHAYRLASWVPAGAPAFNVRARGSVNPPNALLARRRRPTVARRASPRGRAWVSA